MISSSIFHSKINLKIEYHPYYAREVGHYCKTRFDLINREIENIVWNNLFSGHSLDNHVNLFNRTILNIFQSFYTNMIILCNYREPIWANDEIRSFIKRKNLMTHTQKRDNRLYFRILNKPFDDLINAIQVRN